MKILAFESSCDETAVAVVEDGRHVLADAIASQADMHALYGGVVPEIALERACARQGCKLYLPPLRLCGDNGAMIGAQGYYEFLAGHTATMDLNAYATRDISRAV